VRKEIESVGWKPILDYGVSLMIEEGNLTGWKDLKVLEAQARVFHSSK